MPKTGAQSSIEEIVLKLQHGDDAALEHFIRATESACYRLAHSILKDPDLSKDALQEAYLIVYQRIGQLREPSAIKTWLFRILTRCCHNLSKRRLREITSDVETQENINYPLIGISDTPDPAATFTNHARIKAVFERLPEIDRTILALREVADLSYEEMAKALQVPLGTVRSRLAKARQRFISIYKGDNA